MTAPLTYEELMFEEETMKNLFKPVAALLVMALVIPLVLAACGGGEPEKRSFTIEVEGGAPVGGAATFQVKQGDTVTFILRSDGPAAFHLHGYDIEREVTPGETGEMSFEANATGRFVIEIEETEEEVGYLEVQPR